MVLLGGCSTFMSKDSLLDQLYAGLEVYNNVHIVSQITVMNEEQGINETLLLEQWHSSEGMSRIQSTAVGSATNDVVSLYDGENLYTHAVPAAQYTSTPLHVDFPGPIDDFREWIWNVETTLESTTLKTSSGGEIDGRPTIKAEMRAADPENNPINYDGINLWMDKETGAVLKSEILLPGGWISTWQVTMIDYAPKFEEALFIWEVPEGATEVFALNEFNVSPKRTTLLPEQAAEIAQINYQTPTAPEGYELAHAVIYNPLPEGIEGSQAVMLAYTDELGNVIELYQGDGLSFDLPVSFEGSYAFYSPTATDASVWADMEAELSTTEEE